MLRELPRTRQPKRTRGIESRVGKTISRDNGHIGWVSGLLRNDTIQQKEGVGYSCVSVDMFYEPIPIFRYQTHNILLGGDRAVRPILLSDRPDMCCAWTSSLSNNASSKCFCDDPGLLRCVHCTPTYFIWSANTGRGIFCGRSKGEKDWWVGVRNVLQNREIGAASRGWTRTFRKAAISS